MPVLPVAIDPSGFSSAAPSATAELQRRSSSGLADARGVRSAATSFAGQLSRVSGQRVEARRTHITSTQAGDAIAKAYAELTGEALEGDAKAILTAQWAHETGHGASMYNYNFGGIKGVGPSGLSVAQRTREGYGASERTITDQFRAYAGIDEGAKDYVNLLISRYGDAVNAAKQGDATGFVRGLRQRGYFTGDPAAYERSITSIKGQLGAGTAVSSARVATLPAARTQRQAFEALVGRRSDELGGRAINEAKADLGLGASSLIESRHLAALMAPPQPMALLGVSIGRDSELGDEFEETLAAEGDEAPLDLSAIRALMMTDEVTRSAFALSREDQNRRPHSEMRSPDAQDAR